MERKQWANIVIVLVGLSVIALGVKRFAEAPDIVSLFNPEVAVSNTVEILGNTVDIDSAVLNINQVSKRVKAVFILTNRSARTVRDISISCNFYNDNGDFWGRGRWNILQTLEPGRSDRYVVSDTRYISHNAIADKSVCKIVDLSLLGDGVKPKDSGH